MYGAPDILKNYVFSFKLFIESIIRIYKNFMIFFGSFWHWIDFRHDNPHLDCRSVIRYDPGLVLGLNCLIQQSEFLNHDVDGGIVGVCELLSMPLLIVDVLSNLISQRIMKLILYDGVAIESI